MTLDEAKACLADWRGSAINGDGYGPFYTATALTSDGETFAIVVYHFLCMSSQFNTVEDYHRGKGRYFSQIEPSELRANLSRRRDN